MVWGCSGALSAAVEPLSRHIVAAVRALQTKKRRHLGTFQPLLVCFFQLVFVQGNAVQQITLILGGCIIIDAEPFADCTELVKHFNSSRGHSFDLDIHKNSFSQKREGKNRPVATNFQFLKIFCPLGQLLVGACLPQTLHLLGAIKRFSNSVSIDVSLWKIHRRKCLLNLINSCAMFLNDS